jgi:uncharacterized protein YbjT (DUF2867 family)
MPNETPETHEGVVCVFGGTGFLGRRIVAHLRDQGSPVRIASRHPVRSRSFHGRKIEPFRADTKDES